MAVGSVTNNNFTKRVTHVTVDSLGIDPLSDKALSAIDEIVDFVYYTVKPDEAQNAPLIAFRQYGGDKSAWWIILAYNGILDMYTLRSGQTIRIPNYSAVVSRLTDLSLQTNNNGTVRI